MKNIIAVIVEACPDTGLYVAYVPGIAGAHTQAATLDELDANLRELMELIDGTDRGKGGNDADASRTNAARGPA